MVEFSVGFDTQKNDDICKEIVENIPQTVLELIEGTRSGNEQAVAVSVVKGRWYVSTVMEGDEAEIKGDIMNDIWMEAMTKSGDYNANTSDIYMIHTHPSGLAGMSFNDVVSSITGAMRGAPITGDFVMTEHKGRIKINGVTLKVDPKRENKTTERLVELKDRAKTMRKAVANGQFTNGQGKSTLLEEMSEFFDTCSYMVSVADIENRARQQ